MFQAMRFLTVFFVVLLAGCSTVQEQTQAAQQKAATLGNRIETKVAETGASAQRKAWTFWQWLTGGGEDDSSANRVAKRRASTASPSGTPAPLDTVPQQYVGSQSR
jgi:hypothetical protein